MTITARHRHMLEVADRTADVEVIAAIVDTVICDGVSPFEVEQAFRDAAAQSYLIDAGELTIVIGIKQMLDALAEHEITPDENRDRLKG